MCIHAYMYVYSITLFVHVNLHCIHIIPLMQLGSYFGGTVAAVDVNGDG